MVRSFSVGKDYNDRYHVELYPRTAIDNEESIFFAKVLQLITSCLKLLYWACRGQLPPPRTRPSFRQDEIYDSVLNSSNTSGSTTSGSSNTGDSDPSSTSMHML